MEIKDNDHDIIASIYDKDGNYYLVKENKKVFLKDESGDITEITDQQRILDILKLFDPGRTDVFEHEL